MLDLVLVHIKMCESSPTFDIYLSNSNAICFISWRAYDTREGIEVAWNVIKLKRIPVNDRKRVKNEVLLLKEIEHKNIIKYHSSWIDREKQCVIFITEIMSSGSIKELVITLVVMCCLIIYVCI